MLDSIHGELKKNYNISIETQFWILRIVYKYNILDNIDNNLKTVNFCK